MDITLDRFLVTMDRQIGYPNYISIPINDYDSINRLSDESVDMDEFNEFVNDDIRIDPEYININDLSTLKDILLKGS